MSEKIKSIEKSDIHPSPIEPGGTAIVFQRHEKYERDKTQENAGSIFPDAAAEAKQRDIEFFKELLGNEGDAETMVLFVSSDTQYGGKGRRSLETGQLAQDAATEVMEENGINPEDRIINLNSNFLTKRSSETHQNIRPIERIREPQIFGESDKPYLNFLKAKYGQKEDGSLSPEAWGAHEADLEKEEREKHGTESVHDILDRTKSSLSALEQYARRFHERNPGKRLVIWATSHYDTISPLVKDATGADLKEYLPVDYGGGVMINIPPGGGEVVLEAQSQKLPLKLGKRAVKQLVDR